MNKITINSFMYFIKLNVVSIRLIFYVLKILNYYTSVIDYEDNIWFIISNNFIFPLSRMKVYTFIRLFLF